MRRNSLQFSSTCPALVAAIMAATSSFGFAESTESAQPLDEILIWGREAGQRSSLTHPSSVLTPADLVSINIATTEDVVKFEPSLVIRRRFIGDSNGTMGMRGSNMFQTSRSMVFADGVPLHYLLQSRWNGSPRWTMVSASEIAQVEVLYGPFSAQYSGNAMGGVVLIESAIPQQREFHFDSSFFAQSFDDYGFNDTLYGYKSFFSAADKIGDLSLYFSVNRLENDSQPQIFHYAAPSIAMSPAVVSGGIVGNDEFGNSQLWFGDTGVVDTETNNYKFKAGYEFGDWAALLNVAYEDRSSINQPTAYMRRADGSAVWSGIVRQQDRTVAIPAAALGISDHQRDSLSLGLRLRGPLNERADLEFNINHFDILKDEARNSQRNPADPAHTPVGQITDFGKTGWQTADAKLTLHDTGIKDLALVSGMRFEQYEMNIDVFSSSNYRQGLKSAVTSRSGGETDIAAVFAQLEWMANAQWEFTLGARYEAFNSSGGYYSSISNNQLELVKVPGQSRKALSPKFTAAWQASERWSVNYAAARAHRFPIVEELFSQYQAYNAINEANPALLPEDGLHHNLGLEYSLDSGYLRVNIFQETIKDVIEAQATTLPGGVSVRTFIPLDEVETLGAEFIANVDGFLNDALDLRFNMTYTDNSIVRNRADPSLEGNVYPRLPRWRGNLLANWHISERWDAGINYQYASNSFGRIDNLDIQNRVYGAQDAYSRVGLKTDYRLDNGLSLGLGVDNLSNAVDYVAHPWPGRTVYLNVAYDW